MRIVFMGTPDFAVPCLDALICGGYDVAGVVTQPDRPAGRKHGRPAPPPVKEAALKHGIKTILQPEKVRTPEFVESIKNLCPDLIVTAAYGRILTKDVLDVPKHGCINVHASLLPKYRGAAPIQWAIINGDDKTGVTTMLMDEGTDTGDILLSKEIAIPPDMNYGELSDRLKALGAEVLIETLRMLENGTLTRTPQDHSKAVYAPMMAKETGMIDWKKDARRIHNLVRGTNPWPGAFTFYRGRRMKIWKTAVADGFHGGGFTGAGCAGKTGFGGEAGRGGKYDCFEKSECGEKNGRGENAAAVPGTIIKILKHEMIVATGGGCLAISELQFENGRRMGVCECGHNMDEGEVLG